MGGNSRQRGYQATRRSIKCPFGKSGRQQYGNGYGYGYGNGNGNGNGNGMQQQQQRNRSSLEIEFMSPPPIKVKGARELPTSVHNQNVNRGRPRIGSKKKFKDVTASLVMEPQPAQTGYNSPVSS